MIPANIIVINVAKIVIQHGKINIMKQIITFANMCYFPKVRYADTCCNTGHNLSKNYTENKAV